jgi:hypothetical protein
MTISNSLFSYGIYSAITEFTGFQYTNGSSASFQVLSPILANTLTANSVMDQGQYQTLTMELDGGTPPFTYNYIIYNALGDQIVNALYSNASMSNALTFKLNPSYGTGAFTANVAVTDSYTPANTAANRVAFGVNTMFDSSSFFPFSSSVTNSSPQFLAATVIGGTPPYHYNFYIYNSTNVLVDWWLGIEATQPSMDFVYQQQHAWGSGPFTAQVMATDSAISPAQVTNSLGYTVTGPGTPPSSTTTTIPVTGNVSTTVPGSGNGGGGGGGGGPQKPVILTIQNGYLVLNIATLNTFNVTLFGVRLNFTENFEGPAAAGITVNGNTYLLTPNQTVALQQNKNPDYIDTVQLYNISWTPVLHTIALIIRGIPSRIPINITSQNATYEIITYNDTPTLVRLLGENTTLNLTSSSTAYQLLTIRNVTASNSLPPLPKYYIKQVIEQINVSAMPNQYIKSLNTTVGVKVRYNCTLPFYLIFPFILSNYSWQQISTFTVDSKACAVVLTFGNADPIVAVTKYVGPSNGVNINTTTTTIPLTTTMPLTTNTTILPARPPLVITTQEQRYIFAFIVIVFVIAVITVYGRHKARKIRELGKKPLKTLHKDAEALTKPSSKKAAKGIKAVMPEGPPPAARQPGGLRCAQCNHGVVRLPSGEVFHGTPRNSTVLCLERDCSCSTPRILKGKFIPPKIPDNEEKPDGSGEGHKRQAEGIKPDKKGEQKVKGGKPKKPQKESQEPAAERSTPGIPEEPVEGGGL